MPGYTASSNPRKKTTKEDPTLPNAIVSTDKSRLDIPLIHDYIANRSYWGKNRTLAQMHTAIEHSECFGLYLDSAQIGFARVVTDKVNIAYLADVFVLEAHQGKGFGHQLMDHIINDPQFNTVSWLLRTNDAHSLYEKFGFAQLQQDGSFMRKTKD